MIISPNKRKGLSPNRARNFRTYVDGINKCNGEKRVSVPLHYFGIPAPVFDIWGRAYGRVSRNAITSFNLNFSELLPISTIAKITAFVDHAITAGLEAADVLKIAYAHQKENGGIVSSDAHIGYGNALLSNGVRWQPYFEESDRAFFTAVTELINFRFKLSSPKDPERRRRLFCVPRADDAAEEVTTKETIQKAIMADLKDGKIRNRAEFHASLRKCQPDAEISLRKHSIVIVMAGKDELLLRGTLCREGHNFALDADQLSKWDRKTEAEYLADYERGLALRRARHKMLYRRKSRLVHLRRALPDLVTSLLAERAVANPLLPLVDSDAEKAIAAIYSTFSAVPTIEELLQEGNISSFYEKSDAGKLKVRRVLSDADEAEKKKFAVRVNLVSAGMLEELRIAGDLVVELFEEAAYKKLMAKDRDERDHD